ncbi:MAG TPA: hypothetical protein ENH82_13200 [bacterium]|nr:hypothetical protein [bacterium]
MSQKHFYVCDVKRGDRMKKLLLICLLLISCSESELLVSLYDVPDMENMQEVLEYMNKADFEDCIEAAETADIACRSLGYNTLLVSLRGKSWHRVCIAWDKKGEWYLFSNNRYGLIRSEDWREPTLAFFNGAYRKIVILHEHNQGSIE